VADRKIQLPKAKPLGGWVVLSLVWMVLFSVFQGRTLLHAFSLLDAVQRLEPSHQISFFASVVANAVLCVALPVWLLILCVDRDRRFPRGYVIWAASIPVWFALDSLMSYLITKPLHDDGRLNSLGSLPIVVASVVGFVIWAPYMLKSRHVRETFTSS
jgi:hypothetical protein